MDMTDAERIKQREIAFQAIHPNPDQAGTACRFLSQVAGVLSAEPQSPLLLRVRYDVLETSLQELEEALEELGLHLDSRLLYRLRRGLYYYTEETLRANHGVSRDKGHHTQKLFAIRYEQMAHGCRDERPEHWRRYL